MKSLNFYKIFRYLERNKISQKMMPNGVQIDMAESIYESFHSAKIVISELSTGLFEALGISENILIWETEKTRFAFPDIPFNSFSTFDELETKIQTLLSIKTMDDGCRGDLFWASDWENRMMEFVNEFVK